MTQFPGTLCQQFLGGRHTSPRTFALSTFLDPISLILPTVRAPAGCALFLVIRPAPISIAPPRIFRRSWPERSLAEGKRPFSVAGVRRHRMLLCARAESGLQTLGQLRAP